MYWMCQWQTLESILELLLSWKRRGCLLILLNAILDSKAVNRGEIYMLSVMRSAPCGAPYASHMQVSVCYWQANEIVWHSLLNKSSSNIWLRLNPLIGLDFFRIRQVLCSIKLACYWKGKCGRLTYWSNKFQYVKLIVLHIEWLGLLTCIVCGSIIVLDSAIVGLHMICQWKSIFSSRRWHLI